MGESGARVKRAARSAGAAARAGKPRAPDVHITCLLRAYVDLTPHRHLRLSRLLEPPVAGHPRCGARGGVTWRGIADGSGLAPELDAGQRVARSLAETVHWTVS